MILDIFLSLTFYLLLVCDFSALIFHEETESKSEVPNKLYYCINDLSKSLFSARQKTKHFFSSGLLYKAGKKPSLQ